MQDLQFDLIIGRPGLSKLFDLVESTTVGFQAHESGL